MDSGKEARAGAQGRRSGQGHKPKTEPGIQGKNSRHKLRTKTTSRTSWQEFREGTQGRDSGQRDSEQGFRARCEAEAKKRCCALECSL